MFLKIFTFLGDLLRSFLDPFGPVPPENILGTPGGKGGGAAKPMLGKCQKNICIQTKFFRPSERRLSVHLSDLQLSSFKIRILHILQKLSQGIKKNLYFCQMKSIYFLILTSRKLIKNPYELHCPFRNCYCVCNLAYYNFLKVILKMP